MDQVAVLRELKVNLSSPWKTMAQKLGLSKQRVLDLVGLLDLPDKIKEDIRTSKLTEKHGRALRQLLDQAEVLREVFNFLKEKKLTGDQSLELVRKLKSEPGFTTKEAFKNIEIIKKAEAKKPKEPQEIIFSDVERLTKTIKKINFEELKKDQMKKIVSLLSLVKIIIDSFVSKLED